MKGNVNKLDPWADDGGSQIVTPSGTKIAHGWDPGEQPPAQWENWRVNRDNEKINELIDQHDLNCENDFNDSIIDRCVLQPNASALLNPASAINRLDVTSPAIVSICRGYDYVNEKECIFGLQGTPSTPKIVKISNLADGTIDEAIVSVNLPTAYTPVDICCDGYYLFVLYVEAGTPDKSHVYRVPIGSTYTDGISTTYDANIECTDCAAEAPKLTGTSTRGGKRICVADADNIAFLDYRNDGIAIVTKALDSYDYGQGNFDALAVGFTATGITSNGICSDGTRIWSVYYGTYSGDTYYILCAALISNPSTVAAGLTRDWETDPVFWVYSESGVFGSGVFALVYDGHNINVCCNTITETDDSHYSFVAQFEIETEFYFAPRFKIPSGHTEAGANNGGACFTGRHLAVICPVNPIEDMSDGSFFDYCNMYQTGLALINPINGGWNCTGLSIAWDVQSATIDDSRITALESPAVATVASQIVEICFADGCIWALKYSYPLAGSAVDAIEIIRIPAVAERG